MTCTRQALESVDLGYPDLDFSQSNQEETMTSDTVVDLIARRKPRP